MEFKCLSVGCENTTQTGLYCGPCRMDFEIKKTMSKTDNKTVDGVGPDAPTVINEKGGKQSKVLYRFDLLDPMAMFEMTRVLEEGAKKYGENNWHNIPVVDHLNHMLIHAYAYLAGDRSDEHLSHIMCRAMFAQAVEIMDRGKTHDN